MSVEKNYEKFFSKKIAIYHMADQLRSVSPETAEAMKIINSKLK